MSDENNKMKRGLKNRHMQMIALGTSIGTGLFYVMVLHQQLN